jgi:hypothetical protein
VQIVYSRAAAKTLTRMPANTARLIRAWRAIFREEGIVLAIIRIAPRSRAYD